MTDYKLVPVEPTPDMVAALKARLIATSRGGILNAGHALADAISAAPAVQGESLLVGYIRRSAIELMENDELGVRANIIKEPRYRDCLALYAGPIADEQASPQDEQEAFEQYYHRLDLSRDLVSGAYLDREVRSLWDAWQARAELAASACSQPAEQKPSAGDSLTSVPDEVFAAEFAAWWEEHGQFCRAGGGTYEQSFAFEAWRHLYPQLMNLQMAAAEHQPAPDVTAPSAKFKHGDLVRKTKGSQWKGRVVGTYSTELTPEGYAVESDTEKGSVQIYPAAALEMVGEDAEPDVSGLVEALESLMESESRGRVMPVGKSWDQARKALSSHRKQGGGA